LELRPIPWKFLGSEGLTWAEPRGCNVVAGIRLGARNFL